MKDGMSMETTDGKTISMSGNEVGRLYMQKKLENRKLTEGLNRHLGASGSCPAHLKQDVVSPQLPSET
jgi:hypothetical protein